LRKKHARDKESLPSPRLAGLQWQKKYAGWGLLHIFCAAAQHCIIHHTVHKKVNHSTAASQERTPVKPPAVPGLPVGQTCWRARWASPVLRTCLIPTTWYGRSRNQPLPNRQHGCSCCRRRGIAKPTLTVTLSRWTSKQSCVCHAVGSDCIWLRLGMRMPRVW